MTGTVGEEAPHLSRSSVEVVVVVLVTHRLIASICLISCGGTLHQIQDGDEEIEIKANRMGALSKGAIILYAESSPHPISIDTGGFVCTCCAEYCSDRVSQKTSRPR